MNNDNQNKMKHSLKQIFTKENENKSPAARRKKSAVISEICGNYLRMKNALLLFMLMSVGVLAKAQTFSYELRKAEFQLSAKPIVNDTLIFNATMVIGIVGETKGLVKFEFREFKIANRSAKTTIQAEEELQTDCINFVNEQYNE